ncbi:MAG: hypothetical protein L3J22_09900 [Xanthomonadales bacterium]|nr:hypothetical protein [Xanthomonadales bacterium]
MKHLILLVFLIVSSITAYAEPTAKVTIVVVDVKGVPIKNASAGVVFAPENFKEGLTDRNGLFQVSGRHESRVYVPIGYKIYYFASAEGYYSSKSHVYDYFSTFKGIRGSRTWEPWNPRLKITLKKKIDPIPMYAYFADWIKVAKQDEFLGYDLVKHDWVPPYGHGVISDFIFKIEKNTSKSNEVEERLSITFSNKDDGLQDFFFKEERMPRSIYKEKIEGRFLSSSQNAPINGYHNKLEHLVSKIVSIRKFNESTITSYLIDSGLAHYYIEDGTNYYFRVRCTDDKKESCLYGKIYGNFDFKSNTVRFKYFLNPSMGDTNIEFDPEQNLFKNLKNAIITP